MLDLGCGVGGVEPRVMSRRVWSAFVLAAVLAIAGCSPDEEGPGTLPERTPADTSSASPTPSERGTPTESSAPTADATEALEAEITEFLKEYIRVSDESWDWTDALKRRRGMFADSCSICMSGYEMAEEAQSEGLKFEGESGRVVSVSVTAQNDDIVSALAQIDAPAAQLVNANGDVVQEFEANLGSQVVYQIRMEDSGEWVIVRGEALS